MRQKRAASLCGRDLEFFLPKQPSYVVARGKSTAKFGKNSALTWTKKQTVWRSDGEERRSPHAIGRRTSRSVRALTPVSTLRGHVRRRSTGRGYRWPTPSRP